MSRIADTVFLIETDRDEQKKADTQTHTLTSYTHTHFLRTHRRKDTETHGQRTRDIHQKLLWEMGAGLNWDSTGDWTNGERIGAEEGRGEERTDEILTKENRFNMR